MATFTVDFFCSLDGYGSAEGWPGYWGKEGPELRDDRVRTFAQDQVLVFGATTFREFRGFVAEYDEPYYDSLNSLPKIDRRDARRPHPEARLHPAPARRHPRRGRSATANRRWFPPGSPLDD